MHLPRTIIQVLASGLDFQTGLTVKHFISQRSALEGLLSTRWRGFEITGLYEVHNNAFDVERLNWYFGGGGHIGFWNGDNTYGRWGDARCKLYSNRN